MKRAIFCVLATFSSLYAILGYKVPATIRPTQLASQPMTEMTLAPDPTASPENDGPVPGDPPAEPVVESTTTTMVVESTTTTVIPAPVADSPPTTAAPAVRPSTTVTTSKAPTTTAKPATTTTTTTTAKPAPTTTTAPANRTVNGPVITTQYGPVQVSVTMQGTKIVGIKSLQTPTGGASDSINAAAVPKLESQTLQAQSANIAGVSGATYTSTGWKQSLQGALSQ